MSDYTEKNSNLIPKIDIPCFAWNSQAEQGLLFFKAKSLHIHCNCTLKKTICYYDTENEQLSIIKQPSEIKQMKIY